ncbi:hypothetical protein [uncultured Vibrio sp.]|uniref:hypothetical protein n=1 Tax=uncultured Vibrio sp. TaxID=114054 RepID=UPI002AAC2B9A|nr:hypothetical protein [uncultured Vibrio sp.]
MANTLWPKGNESGKEVGQCSFVVIKLSALEWASNLTLRDIRNTVSLYRSLWDSFLRREPIVMQVEDTGESECCIVMM